MFLFSCKHLYSNDLLNFNVFNFTDIQIRNFKTDRNIHSESGRNPNLVSRMRTLLGLEENSTSIKVDKIVIGPVELEKMKSKYLKENQIEMYFY